MTDINDEFKKMVVDAGLPTTEAEALAMWETVATEAGSPFNNNSDYSPFWRGISRLVTAPVLWLVNQLMISSVLPNFFLKTAKKPFLDLFGWALDCERKQAVNAIGVIRFSRLIGTGDIEIPSGTKISSTNINGVNYSLVTTQRKVLVNGALTIDVPVQAADVGAAYNLAENYYTVLTTAITGIDAVTNAQGWLITPGADEEQDEDYRLRIRNQFTAVNQFHTDAVYRKLITTFAGINTRNVYFEHGAPRGPGTANAYILLDVGEPSPALLQSIHGHIMTEGNHGHGDDLMILAMPHTTHNLNVTLVVAEYLTESEKLVLVNAVTNAIRAAFRENTNYGMTVTKPFSLFSFSKLASELHQLFSDVQSIHFSVDDIESQLAVPRLGTLVVVIND